MNLLRVTVLVLAFTLCGCNRNQTLIKSGPRSPVTSTSATFDFDNTSTAEGQYAYSLNGGGQQFTLDDMVTFSGLTTGTYTFTVRFVASPIYQPPPTFDEATHQWTVITGTPSGTPELAFAPDVGVIGNRVVATAVQPDGKILIAGFFTAVNTQTRNFIARLEPTGALEDTMTFNPGIGADSFISCVAVQADGKILLGGGFSSVAGQPRNRIARLLPTGALEGPPAFVPGTGANSTVNCLAVQADLSGVYRHGPIPTIQ